MVGLAGWREHAGICRPPMDSRISCLQAWKGDAKRGQQAQQREHALNACRAMPRCAATATLPSWQHSLPTNPAHTYTCWESPPYRPRRQTRRRCCRCSMLAVVPVLRMRRRRGVTGRLRRRWRQRHLPTAAPAGLPSNRRAEPQVCSLQAGGRRRANNQSARSASTGP